MDHLHPHIYITSANGLPKRLPSWSLFWTHVSLALLYVNLFHYKRFCLLFPCVFFNSKENEMHQCLVWDLCSEIGAEHCQDTWLHGRRCIVPFLLSWTCHDFHKTLCNNLTRYFYWSSYYCSILHFLLLLASLITQQTKHPQVKSLWLLSILRESSSPFPMKEINKVVRRSPPAPIIKG